MARFLLKILIFLLLLILGGEVFGLLWTINSSYKQTLSIERLQPTIAKSILTTPPPISESYPPYTPGGFKWSVSGPLDKKALSSDKERFLLYISGNTLAKNLITGSEWVSMQKYKTNEERLLTKNRFDNYFSQTLSAEGWIDKLNLDQFSIQTLKASNPLEDVWGYVKQLDESVKYIVISEQVDAKVTELGITCPCTVEYRIFLGDPIPLSKIINPRTK